MLLPVMGVVLVAGVLFDGCGLEPDDVPGPLLPEPPLTQADKDATIARGSSSFFSETAALREDLFGITIDLFPFRSERHPASCIPIKAGRQESGSALHRNGSHRGAAPEWGDSRFGLRREFQGHMEEHGKNGG